MNDIELSDKNLLQLNGWLEPAMFKWFVKLTYFYEILFY